MDEGTTQTNLTTTPRQRTKAMTIQELQAAIEAYRLTVTTEDQANELHEILSNEVSKVEEIVIELAEMEVETQEEDDMEIIGNWLEAQEKTGSLYFDTNSFEWIENEEFHYQVTLEDSYEFHYWDEEADENVSTPIENLNHLHQLINSLK